MITNNTEIVSIAASKKSPYDRDENTADGKTSVRYAHEINKNIGIKLNDAVLIAGFSGPGLVGSIGTGYIIEKLNMHQIACIDSEFIIPGVIYIGGKLRHPFRLYTNQQKDVCILQCEAPIMIHGIHSVLDTTTKWCVDNKIKKVFVLEGYPVRGMPTSKRKPIILSSDNKEQIEMNENVRLHATKNTNMGSDQNRGLRKKHFENAFIGGISGGLLSACLSNEIPCTALLIPTTIGVPDPEGAASLVEVIGRITENEKLNIDAGQLRNQGAALRKQMEEIIRSLQDQQQLQQGEDMTGQRRIMYG
jgi:uncharacterized protein